MMLLRRTGQVKSDWSIEHTVRQLSKDLHLSAA